MATVPFTLRIDAGVKKRLEQEAKREDRSAGYIAQQAIRAYVEAKERARAAIRDAEAEADKGVFISSAAMDKWVRSWGSDDEQAPPEPDVMPRR